MKKKQKTIKKKYHNQIKDYQFSLLKKQTNYNLMSK